VLIDLPGRVELRRANQEFVAKEGRVEENN
jgi:hypothetical protein